MYFHVYLTHIIDLKEGSIGFVCCQRYFQSIPSVFQPPEKVTVRSALVRDKDEN